MRLRKHVKWRGFHVIFPNSCTIYLMLYFSLSGELLGVEYLYSQTGRELQQVDLEETDAEDAAEENEEEDEGFQEPEDLTVEDHAPLHPLPLVWPYHRPPLLLTSARSFPSLPVIPPVRMLYRRHPNSPAPLLQLPHDAEFEAIAVEEMSPDSMSLLTSRRRLSFPAQTPTRTATATVSGSRVESPDSPAVDDTTTPASPSPAIRSTRSPSPSGSLSPVILDQSTPEVAEVSLIENRGFSDVAL